MREARRCLFPLLRRPLSPFYPHTPTHTRRTPPPPRSAAFCATHPWLATGSTNGSLLITDLSTSATRHHFSLSGGIIRVAWVPGAAPLLAAATAHGLVRVIDARDGSTRAELTGHVGMVLDMRVSAAGVVTAGDDGMCRVYGL